jgi:hypothetical protein
MCQQRKLADMKKTGPTVLIVFLLGSAGTGVCFCSGLACLGWKSGPNQPSVVSLPAVPKDGEPVEKFEKPKPGPKKPVEQSKKPTSNLTPEQFYVQRVVDELRQGIDPKVITRTHLLKDAVAAYEKDREAANKQYNGRFIRIIGEVSKVIKFGDGTSMIHLWSAVPQQKTLLRVTLRPFENLKLETLKVHDIACAAGDCDGIHPDLLGGAWDFIDLNNAFLVSREFDNLVNEELQKQNEVLENRK